MLKKQLALACKIWLSWLVINSLLIMVVILFRVKDASILSIGWFVFDSSFIFLVTAFYSVSSIPFLAAWFYLEGKLTSTYSKTMKWIVPLLVTIACMLATNWLVSTSELVELFIPFESFGFWAVITVFITSFSIAIYASKNFD